VCSTCAVALVPLPAASWHCAQTLLTVDPLQDAFHNGVREKLIYVPCIVPNGDRPDYLATVDVDPESASYGKVGYHGGLLLATCLHACEQLHIGTGTRSV
jgi:selenium-binding protein 1